MGLNQGKRNKNLHVKCRRCGESSFHKRKKVCASCGFGKSAKLNKPEKQRKA